MKDVPKLLDGRFRVEGFLARGANGDLYRAVQLSNQRPVAIKFLKASGGAAAEFAARFRRECRLLHELDHPAAVRVHGAGIAEGDRPWVAMELLEGRTLAALVERNGPMSPEALADVLDQVADCLDAAHERNIVHRDIKPGNLMLSLGENGRLAVKVLDFGVAKILGKDETNATVVTCAGIAVGTPEYMSPEQALGRAVDGRSDVYSLGVTLFAALTARLPFDGKNALQVMLAHVRDPIPTFQQVAPKFAVPAAVERVVREAMAKEPAERPATAGELARRFRSALAETRVEELAPAPPPKTARATPMPPLPAPGGAEDAAEGSRRIAPGYLLLASLGIALGVLAAAVLQ